MPDEELKNEAKAAIEVGLKLQHCYRNMACRTSSPKIKAVLHDLILMEEMNEVLLRSLKLHLN